MSRLQISNAVLLLISVADVYRFLNRTKGLDIFAIVLDVTIGSIWCLFQNGRRTMVAGQGTLMRRNIERGEKYCTILYVLVCTRYVLVCTDPVSVSVYYTYLYVLVHTLLRT